jgi:hypothetical protein
MPFDDVPIGCCSRVPSGSTTGRGEDYLKDLNFSKYQPRKMGMVYMKVMILLALELFFLYFLRK